MCADRGSRPLKGMPSIKDSASQIDKGVNICSSIVNVLLALLSNNRRFSASTIEVEKELDEHCSELLAGSGISHKITVSKLNLEVKILYGILFFIVHPLLINSKEAFESERRSRKKFIDVRVNINQAENVLTIQVADNGPGWDSDIEVIQHAIWDKKPASTKGEGRGTSLIKLHDIARTAGGILTVKNALKRGAITEIKIPAFVLMHEEKV